MKVEAKKLKILINRDKASLIHMQKEGEQRVREIKTWTKIIKELEPQLKYSAENPEEHQALEWSALYAKRIDILKQTGSTDYDGTLNTILVANKMFNDKNVLKLIAEEK